MTIAPDAPTIDANAIDTAAMADRVVAQVERWLDESAGLPVDRAAQQLAGVLGDPGGLAFTVGFIDGVIRPEDTRIAARNFARLARDVPRFLPLYLQLAVRLGAIAAVIVPPIVIPIVRWALRKMVGHLVIDATDAKLGRAIEKLRSKGARLNINLLGEAVLGEREAARRLDGTQKLLGRDPTSTTCRSRSRRPSRRTRPGRSTRPSPASSSASLRSTSRPARRARRSSSTSTWRSTATST